MPSPTRSQPYGMSCWPSRLLGVLTFALSQLGSGCTAPAEKGDVSVDAPVATSESPLTTRSLALIPSTSQVIDTPTNYPWNTGGISDKLVTYNGYQYGLYWNADRKLILSRRRLSDNYYDYINLGYTMRQAGGGEGTDDPHRQPNLGICALDGTLHLTYDQHHDTLRYKRSLPQFLTNPPSTMTLGDFETPDRWVSALLEDHVTYPQFFNDSAGHLYVSYRHGWSGRGDQRLDKYNETNQTWSAIGMMAMGNRDDFIGNIPGTYANSAPYTGCTQRNVYDTKFRFDARDRLHAFWTWRDKCDNDSFVNHGYAYAYSDDYGIKWKNDAGTQIANLQNNNNITCSNDTPCDHGVEGKRCDVLVHHCVDAITINDTGLHPFDFGVNRNTHLGLMDVDSHNQPHVAVVISTASGSANMQRMHIWRNPSGAWFANYLENTSVFTEGPYNEGLASISFDSGDNMYVVGQVSGLTWTPTGSFNRGYAPWDADYGPFAISDFGWRNTGNGIIEGFVNDPLAEIGANPISVPVTSNKIVKVKLWNRTASARARLWWVTTSGEMSTQFAITPNDSTFRQYTIDLSGAPTFTGTLNGLYIQPAIDAGSTGYFDIDYIRVQNSSGVVAANWDFTQCAQLGVIEANPTDNYTTNSMYSLNTGSCQSFSEAFLPDRRRLKTSRIVSVLTNEMNASTGVTNVAVREFALTNDNVVTKAWEFASSTEYWGINGGLSAFSQSNGVVSGTVSASQASIYNTDAGSMAVDLNANKIVKVKFSNSSLANQAKFRWLTTTDLMWNDAKSQVVAVVPNSGQIEYLVDMSGISSWSGTLKALMFYPAYNSPAGSFAIDYIRIVPFGTTRSWEFSYGVQDWLNSRNVTGYGVTTTGAIGGTVTTAPAEIWTDETATVGVNLEGNKTVKVNMKNSTSATQAKLYWLTTTDGTWNEAKSKVFSITPNDSGFRVYTVSMSGIAGWAGTLKVFDLYPALSAASGSFSIDYIRIAP